MVTFTPLQDVPERYPLPIAQVYSNLSQAWAENSSAVEAFLHLKDCYETLSRYTALSVIAVYLQSDRRNDETDRQIIRKLVRPSTGDWPSLVSEVMPMLCDLGHPLTDVIHQAFFTSGSSHKPNSSLKALRDFPNVRNEYLGHSLTRGEAQYRELVSEWGEKLNNLLQDAGFLADWRLIYAYSVADGEIWMGCLQPERPSPLEADLPPEMAGKFLLVRGNDIVNLSPFFLRLRCPECNAIRLCLYDSQQRYTEKKKEVKLIELPGTHRFSSPAPVQELERIFGANLLEQEFKVVYARLVEIETKILDQSRLLDRYTDIVGRSFIDSRVKEFLDQNPKGVFLLTGQPGIGKTAYLARYISERKRYPHFFFSRAGGFSSVDDAVVSLYHQVLKLLEIADLSPAEDAREYLVKFHNLLTMSKRPSRAKVPKIVIVLDAVDEAVVSSSGIQPSDLIPRDLPDDVYFLVSSRESSTAIRLRVRSGTMHLHIDPTSAENFRDAEAYVAQRLSKYALDGDLVHRIAVASEGNFLVLEQMVNQLMADSKQPDQLRAAAEQMLRHPWGSLDDFYASTWDQVVHSEGELELKRSAVDVLGLLSIAQSPMRAEDIALVLGQRQFETELVIEQIRSFLEVRSEEALGAVYYQVYHSTFGGFIHARLGDDLRRYHSLLIKHCQDEQPSASLQKYCDEYLSHHLSEYSRTGSAVGVTSLEMFRPLLTPEMAQARRSIDGNYSAFVRDLDKAIAVAKLGGIQTFPELIEFCLIKSHIFSLGRVLPTDSFAAIAILDGLEKAEESIETIGDRGQRACAYASLASVCTDKSEQELLAQKALELARQSGLGWELLSTYCTVGISLIRYQPQAAVAAFREAVENLSDLDLDYFYDPVDEAIDQLVMAYETGSIALAPVLPWLVKAANSVWAIVGLLNLALTLYANEKEQAEAILEEAWNRLKDMEAKARRVIFEQVEKYWQKAQKTYLEVLALVGKLDLAKERLVVLAGKVGFDETHLIKLQQATTFLEAEDYNAAIVHCNHPIIRRRAITGLLLTGNAKDFQTIVTQYLGALDLMTLRECAGLIVKLGLHRDILQLVKPVTSEEFLFSHNAREFVATLAKELAYTEPDLARSLVNELHSDLPFVRNWGIPYWGDGALIAAITYRKGDSEAKRLCSSLEVDAERLAIKKLVEDLKRIVEPKAPRSVIPHKLKAGWDLYERKDWDELRDWVSQLEIEKRGAWREKESTIDLVKALAESGQMGLAGSLVFKLGGNYAHRARAHIDAVLLRTAKVDLVDLAFGDDEDVVLIKARGLAFHSSDIACSYVRLFGDWLLAERHNDEYLVWSLSRIARFLYEHEQYAEAKRYFLLGCEHAIRALFFESAGFLSKLQLLEGGFNRLSFDDQFPIIQELIILCSSRKPDDVVEMVSMFADVLAKNWPLSQLERILHALKRAREWVAAINQQI